MKTKIAPGSFQAKQRWIQSRKDSWKSSSGTEQLGRGWLLLQVHHQEAWANPKDGRTQTGDARMRWFNTQRRKWLGVEKSFNNGAMNVWVTNYLSGRGHACWSAEYFISSFNIFTLLWQRVHPLVLARQWRWIFIKSLLQRLTQRSLGRVSAATRIMSK